MYKILKTGSKGNAVIYHKSIMVDCGVPYSLIKKHVNSLQIVLLSHQHSDHLNISTIKKLQQERPSLRVGCCKWMLEKLEGVNNVDIYEIGKLYDYGSFQVSPILLFHDVPNCGYRIYEVNFINNINDFRKENEKVIKSLSFRNYGTKRINGKSM